MLGRDFSETFRALLPGVVIGRERTKQWHSATFSGERRSWQMALAGPECDERARRFATALVDHEFVLSGWLVADIAVTDQHPLADGSVVFTVEALLLDDEL